MPAKKTDTQPLGSVWEIPSKSRVEVTRPDGSTVEVDPSSGSAQLVLSMPGEYVSGDHSVTAK